jgi:hypothetical protein
MKSLSGLPRAGRLRYVNRSGSRLMRGFLMLVGAATCASFAASATSASDSQRFQLAGSGTLTLDQPLQKSGNVQLSAYLTPTALSPPTLEGGTFSLTALLSTSSLVCYNDTIFRDGFDGTGL